ncbi:MAG: hypothetical protein KAS67_01590, partial [Thermoplasmata archaeon]|nr:hypothetical protein [Thermoplasmata archaeon]
DVLFSFHAQSLSDLNSTYRMVFLKDIGSEDEETHFLHIYPVWESSDGLQAALRFQLQVPYTNFFKNSLSCFVLPYHIWGSTESGQPYDNMKIWLDEGYLSSADDAWDVNIAMDWGNPNPIGSGPFKWKPDSSEIIFDITTWREHFYKPGFEYDSEAKQPSIEAMVFKKFHDDDLAVQALKNDEMDIIRWPILPTFIPGLMNEHGISTVQYTGQGFFSIGYNMRERSFGYDEAGFDYGKPLRKAIALCIDRWAFGQMDIHSLGCGITGNGPVSSTSVWYNDTIPECSFDLQEAKKILERAGYQLTDPSSEPGPGNWWLNPDGTKIGNGSDGKIEILTPREDNGPHIYYAANQMRKIGINAEAKLTDPPTLSEKIKGRNFEMFQSRWMINSDPTEFLYAFLHSENSASGPNYVGYRNESYDANIELAMSAMNHESKSKAIKDAQASIVYDLPFDVLYFRTSIEAYRSDRFVNWVADDSGSIFNIESIYNIRSPRNNKLNAKFVNTVSAVESNGTADVEVLVTGISRNDDGTITRAPVVGAYIELDVSDGTLSQYNGTTDQNGKLLAQFHAPYIPPTMDHQENGSMVFIEVKSATSEGYDDAPGKLALITVYPDIVPFLTAQIYAEPDVIEDIDVTGTPGTTNIVVTVKDKHGVPANGATVIIKVDPSEPNITPESAKTDSTGSAKFTFNAANVDEDKEYLVSVIAYKEGYKNATQHFSVYVIDVSEIIENGHLSPNAWLIPLSIALVIIAVATTVIVAYLKRRKI